MPATSRTSPIYQLKITLRGSKPPIWRRVLVPGAVTLEQLHRVIQGAMGWADYHLHEFVIDGVSYGVPDPDVGLDDVENERRVRLSRLIAAPGAKFRYVYDFGDGWEHNILVEKVAPLERGRNLPAVYRGQTRLPAGGLWRHMGVREFPGGDPRSRAPRAC